MDRLQESLRQRTTLMDHQTPLSTMLNNSEHGYEVQGKKINHLFYMDDLKTYAKNDNQQEGLLQIVKLFSDDICMQFGLDKCAKATFKKGKLTSTSNIQLDQETVIMELNQEDTYKYLGVNEGDGIQHATMKEKVKKEYYRRVRLVIKSELNAANKIKAINILAVPTVTYSFNIINWQLKEVKKLDTKTRKLLTSERMHHPKADVERMYLPRQIGGRGLTQLEMAYKTTTMALKTYLETTDDALLILVCQHEARKKLYSVTKEAIRYAQELNIPEVARIEKETVTSFAKRTRREAKKWAQKRMRETWEEKPMHGQYPLRVKKADVEQDHTHQWLRSAGLKAETEGLLIAAQDQSLSTRLYHHKIMKDGTDPMCRMCSQYEETIDHIVSGCPTLARTEYIHRHDRAASYIHWKICKHFHLPAADKWYEHQPPTVTENNNIAVLWDMPINTDREIMANRPDIVIKNKEEKTCLMIDMTIPSEKNVTTKELEKLSKYKDLEIEVTRMWGMKTTTIPVVVGALGLIKKGLEKRTKQIPGNPTVQEIQKIVLLGSAHIIRRTLSIN
ncbi:putative LOC107393841-like protein [Nothobranchius furzeri]|uniref:LOC107393841-like protein n=1 Tax=Nothobranchius furzeri TaxID=105023 RepID=A0A9D2YCJ7_NOTFU|nr:putative LOC107393841-like protein [Nothobranchius furzeri]